MSGTERGPEKRREFIKGTAAVGVGVGLIAAASLVTGKARAAAGDIRWGFAIDLTRCTGCTSCSVACKTENNVRLGALKQPNPDSGTSVPVRRAWVQVTENAMTREFLPRLCNQCAAAPCLVDPTTGDDVCPVAPITLGLTMPDKSVVEYQARATYQRPDGVVLVDQDRCIGCGECVRKCPYNARYQSPVTFFEDDPAKGVVGKCNLCEHRLSQGLQPACVETCPGKARIAGNLDDPDDPIQEWLAKDGDWLLPAIGTEPKVWYVGMKK